MVRGKLTEYFGMYMDPDTRRKLKLMAAKEQKSDAHIVRQLIQEKYQSVETTLGTPKPERAQA